MNDILNQNDLDNLKLAVDKMKSVDFDAARKMELLIEAVETQRAEEKPLAELQEAIEGLPGYASDHRAHVENTAALLGRTMDNVQAWEDAKDDEPLDDAVERLVQAAEAEDKDAARLKTTLTDIISEARKGDPDALSRIRELAEAALP